MRWVGIDEAGYGPNLGPLVMTAVIAESRNATENPGRDAVMPRLDLWRDLASTVDRAGGDPARFWVDDSKKILQGGKGRECLEATCLALLDAAGTALPRDVPGLFACLNGEASDETELARWLPPFENGSGWPPLEWRRSLETRLLTRPFNPADGAWRIVAVWSVVLGPERFNRRLDALDSKARVHFSAFHALLRRAWDLAADGTPTVVKGDKHGGRHYYLEPLLEAVPEAWIDRGPEGPELSRYTLRAPGRSLSLDLAPRADADDGLVALASIVSKTLREVWMDVFNAFWCSRIAGLKPTAGYPTDAARFRRAIEETARDQDLHPDLWWRRK